MSGNNKELQQFVQETLRQIELGKGGHTSVGEVDFEVAVVKEKTGGGKVGVKVLGIGGADAEGKVKTENVSKVKFSIRLKGAALRVAPAKWPPSGSD